MAETPFDRARLISDLEAHYGRWLRSAVITSYQSCAPMADAYREREAEGRSKSMLMSEVMEYIGEVDKSLYDIALEGEAAVRMAREIEDQATLDIFVRWKTLPNWREAMTKQGWMFDEKHLIWEHPEHGRLN